MGASDDVGYVRYLTAVFVIQVLVGCVDIVHAVFLAAKHLVDVDVVYHVVDSGD